MHVCHNNTSMQRRVFSFVPVRVTIYSPSPSRQRRMNQSIAYRYCQITVKTCISFIQFWQLHWNDNGYISALTLMLIEFSKNILIIGNVDCTTEIGNEGNWLQVSKAQQRWFSACWLFHVTLKFNALQSNLVKKWLCCTWLAKQSREWKETSRLRLRHLEHPSRSFCLGQKWAGRQSL
jgi:hypothetical protein